MMQIPKMQVLISPVSATTGATVDGYADLNGFDFAIVHVVMSGVVAPSNKPGALTLRHGSTTARTNGATFSGCKSGTDYTIPDAVTGANSYMFALDWRGRARYLTLAVSPRTTQIISAIAMCYRADEMPDNSTEAGVNLLHVA